MVDPKEIMWPFPDVSWLRAKRLAMGARPGHRPDPHPQVVTHESFVTEYAKALKAASIRRIVCLLTEPELRRFYDCSLLELYEQAGMESLWTEMGATPDMVSIVKATTDALAGDGTLIPCAGGAQRSGIVAACALGRMGACESSEEAVKLVTKKRGFNLHLQPEQAALIDKFYSTHVVP